MTRDRTRLHSALALLLGAGVAATLALVGPQAAPWTVALPPGLPTRWIPESATELTLGAPAALWLVPLAALPFIVLLLRRSLVDVPRWQLALQLLLRLSALAVLALALALPSAQSPLRGKTLVFAIDTSASIDETQLAQARHLVAQAQAQLIREQTDDVAPEDRTRLAVLRYGADPQILPVDANSNLGELLAPSPEPTSLASDHAAALNLATALIDPQTQGRILLLTDGLGTVAERDALAGTAGSLQAAGLELHLRSFAPQAHHDVAVTTVHLPAELRLSQSFDVVVELQSTQEQDITLELLRDGAPNPLESSKQVSLRAGHTTARFQARVTEPGPAVFTARIASASVSPAANRWTGNDQAAVAGEVQGRPRVLLATNDGGGALAGALRADHLDVTVAAPAAVPSDARDLADTDLVIFSDISAGAVPLAAQQAVAKYVVEQGGGFVMIGGEHSYGLGGWDHSPIAGILPVGFSGERQREEPKLALILVIDKSGSMASDDRLELVKEAARATAGTLDPSDQIGVIAFDSRPHVLTRLQGARNRISVAGDIRRLAPGGGTNALPALREAYLQLAGSNALVKHVILLSDGQSPDVGVDALLADMRDGDVTVSAVGVGAGAGKDLLRRIASLGRGRFYFSQDGTDVPRIFSTDTREASRNVVREQLHYPRVAKPAQVLRGIDFTHAPGLRGLVPIEPKPLSETLLRTQQGEPLLVRGRAGIGQSVAFASDAKARWAAPWLSWNGFAKLWAQVARDTLRQGATLLGGAQILIRPGVTQGRWHIDVDVDSPEGFADDLSGSLDLIDPSRDAQDPARTQTLPLRLVAPGRYGTELFGLTSGQRLLQARFVDPATTPPRTVAQATSQLSLPYPAELDLQAQAWNETALNRVPAASHDGPIDDVVASPGEAQGRLRSEALWPRVLVWWLLPLLLVDLAVRRVPMGRRRRA